MIETGNPLRVGLRREHGAEPCSVVIFGASGDLTRRKLVPALYNLHVDRLLPPGFAVVGAARSEMSNEAFVASLLGGTREHSRRGSDEAIWQEIAAALIASTKVTYARTLPACVVASNHRNSTVPLSHTACRLSPG